MHHPRPLLVLVLCPMIGFLNIFHQSESFTSAQHKFKAKVYLLDSSFATTPLLLHFPLSTYPRLAEKRLSQRFIVSLRIGSDLSSKSSA